MTITNWLNESVVRTGDENSAYKAGLTFLANGGYVVTWIENSKILFQLYSGLGQKVGAPVNILAIDVSADTLPDVQSIGSDGDFLITWTKESNHIKTLLTRKFNHDGSFKGALISEAASLDVSHGARVGDAENGGWSTVYTDRVGVNDEPVILIVHDAEGTQVGNRVMLGEDDHPIVTYLGGSKYVVVSSPDYNEAQLSIVDTATNLVSYTGNFVSSVSRINDVVALKDAEGLYTGQFVALLEDGDVSVEAYIFNADGTFADDQAPSIRIGGAKEDSGALGGYAGMVALRSGGFAVAYQAENGADTGDIFVKVIDKDFNESAPFLVNVYSAGKNNGGQDTPSITEMADGRLAVTWTDGTLGDSLVATTILDARTSGINITAGTSHADTYVGSAFDDTISGSGGDDNLSGGAGADTLNGDAGNDTLAGGAGADILNGGADLDSASYQDATSAVTVNLNTGERSGDAMGDVYTSIEGILGSNFNDNLIGDDSGNKLDGGAGNDTLTGALGADILSGGVGIDTVSYAESTEGVIANIAGVGVGGTAAGDSYSSVENVIGSAFDDTLIGDGAANILVGGTGNDTYVVQNTDDQAVEANNVGTDTVSTSVDFVLGAFVENLTATGTLAVSLTGNDLANNITGNSADNVMNGGAGADNMSGGAGNDIYYVDNAGDVINDTSGNDTVVLSGGGSLAKYSGIENVILSATGAISLDGTELANTIEGNNSANILDGLGGHDTLYGLGGNDQLLGGIGNDLLAGGYGKDVLTGGKGKDTFVFDTKANKRTNVDKVVDFKSTDDTIWLDNAVFTKIGRGTASSPGKLNKAFFKVGAPEDKNDYIVYNKSKGTLYYDSDGSGRKAMVAIATFKPNTELKITDFFVI